MTLFPSCVFNIFNILPITDTLNFFGLRDYHGGEKRETKKGKEKNEFAYSSCHVMCWNDNFENSYLNIWFLNET